MEDPISTKIGDVLILYYTGILDAHVVCEVTEDGQQALKAKQSFLPDRDAAMVMATRLLTPGRHSYVQNTESGKWTTLA